jgi:phosphoglycerate dehydrogenase-like enzyme
MIGEKELQIMKSNAYLINISRGRMIDEPALIKALKEGWIAGAGLDVFETEPLPFDNELWELPNVIISCHMAGYTDGTIERNLDLFCENLKRYIAGEKLLNVLT